MSSITNYSGQCSIIHLCPVLQTTVTSAVSSPYVQYFKTSLLSVAVFISHYSTVIRNITFSPSAQSYSHTVALHADTHQCLLLLNTYTFAGWVTGSLHHNVTGMFFSSLVNQKYDPCPDETWILNKAGKSLMQPMTVCLLWLYSYRCHTQLYARFWSWLIFICGFCLCGIRIWKPHVWWFLEMKNLLKLLQQCSVERGGPIRWCGWSCDFTLLNIFWSNVTEHLYMFTILPSPNGRTHRNWTFLKPAIFWNCAQHKMVIPFQSFRQPISPTFKGQDVPAEHVLVAYRLHILDVCQRSWLLLSLYSGSWFSGET